MKTYCSEYVLSYPFALEFLSLFQFHRPVGVIEKLFPRAVAAVAQVDSNGGGPLGPDWLVDKFHA